MALGLDGLPATRGAIDPGEVAEATTDLPLHFRGNRMNRRRYSGLFALLLALFT